MLVRFLFAASITFLFTVSINVQAQPAAPPQMYSVDPMTNISMEMTRVSRNVENLTQKLKEFVDKFEKVGGMNFTEKQQRLVLGMELLVRAELRITQWQKHQIDLVEQYGRTRAELAAIEMELRPERLERQFQLEGSTRVEELREARRNALRTDQQALMQLSTQLQISLVEASSNLREAQALASRLKAMFLPQIEQELYTR
jgi:hypothetical protein